MSKGTSIERPTGALGATHRVSLVKPIGTESRAVLEIQMGERPGVEVPVERPMMPTIVEMEKRKGEERDGESKRMRLASDMALVHAMENVATQLNKTNGHLDKHSFLMEKYLLVLEKQNLLTEKKLQDSDSSSESESHDDKDLLKLFE